jgi:hypothetical protein
VRRRTSSTVAAPCGEPPALGELGGGHLDDLLPPVGPQQVRGARHVLGRCGRGCAAEAHRRGEGLRHRLADQLPEAASARALPRAGPQQPAPAARGEAPERSAGRGHLVVGRLLRRSAARATTRARTSRGSGGVTPAPTVPVSRAAGRGTRHDLHLVDRLAPAADDALDVVDEQLALLDDLLPARSTWTYSCAGSCA